MARILTLSLLLFSLSCHFAATKEDVRRDVAQVPSHREGIDVDSATDLLHQDEAGKTDPNLSEILELATGTDVGSVYQALRAIKGRFPAYFTRYTLMHHSDSLQDSEYLHPRVLVFGKTARTVITFNDGLNQYPDPSHTRYGYSSLEIMGFDPYGGYQFREIVYPADRTATRNPSMDAGDVDSNWTNPRALVSKVNPEKCLECHGFENPRPIWDHYFSWPAAYGSLGDGSYNYKKDPDYPGSQGLVFVQKPQTPDVERLNYLRFDAIRRNNHASRYYWLSSLKPFDSFHEIHPNSKLQSLFAAQIMTLIAKEVVEKKSDDQVLKVLKSVHCAALKYPVPETLEREFYAHSLHNVDRFKQMIGASLDSRFIGYYQNRPVPLAEALRRRDPDLVQRLRSYFPERSDYDVAAALGITNEMQYGAPELLSTLTDVGIDFHSWATDAIFAPSLERAGYMVNVDEGAIARALVTLMYAKSSPASWLAKHFDVGGHIKNGRQFCAL